MTDNTYGTILSIDPAIGHLGWAMHSIENAGENPELLDYGTIYVPGNSIKDTVETIDMIADIIDQYDPDDLIIEDYSYTPGKTRGMYVVPGMIMLLKYLWYQKYKKSAITVFPQTWKALIIGNGFADKSLIRDTLKNMLTPHIVENITEKFQQIRDFKKSKSDCGEQDCYDAIGLGLYLCWQYSRNHELMVLTEGENE